MVSLLRLLHPFRTASTVCRSQLLQQCWTSWTSKIKAFTPLTLTLFLFLCLPSLAYIPGGAVKSFGKPRKHSGGSCGCRAAGEELPHLQRPRHKDTVPAEVAGYRCKCSSRDQELRECSQLTFASSPEKRKGKQILHVFGSLPVRSYRPWGRRRIGPVQRPSALPGSPVQRSQ